MYSLSDAARAFAPDLPDEARKRFDKALRNLSQRTYLPASDRRGRIDLYDMPTVCALRLLMVANQQGTTGDDLDELARWLQTPKANAGAPIAEAFKRLSDGEAFTLEISMFASGNRSYAFRWESVTEAEARGSKALAFARKAGVAGQDDRTGVFTIFASKLMQETVESLSA